MVWIVNIAIQEEVAFLAEPKHVLAGGRPTARCKTSRKARKKRCEMWTEGIDGNSGKQAGADPHPCPGHAAESVGWRTLPQFLEARAR